VLKNLLIESQRMDNVLVFDAGEQLCECVGKLLISRDVFKVKCASFVMVSDEVIPDVDVLRMLIIRFVLDD
jgi:hypothetical protein